MKIIPNSDLFFRNLRYLRQKYKYTQKQVGRVLGVGQLTVRYMERGNWRPELDWAWPELDWAWLERLGWLFGCDGAELLEKDFEAEDKAKQ